MNNRMEAMPYADEDVVLYMDDLTGTNIVLQPMRTHGIGKSFVGGTPAGTSHASRPEKNPAAEVLSRDTDTRRNNAGARAGEVTDLLSGKRQDDDGHDQDDRRTEDGSPTSRYPRRRFPFDVNIYQQKKTLAQGMMDLALISANANQFRYVLQSSGHPYYMTSLSMIGTSLFLQIIVGIGLIWNSTYNVKKDSQAAPANKVNNLTVIGIFLVTILNVFITSFGVAEPLRVDGNGKSARVLAMLSDNV